MSSDDTKMHQTILEHNLLDGVHTWEDFYTRIDAHMEMASSGSAQDILSAMFVMYAFMQAMRDMPDEGDIRRLIRRTIHILVYESAERMGVELSLNQEAEAVRAQAPADATPSQEVADMIADLIRRSKE